MRSAAAVLLVFGAFVLTGAGAAAGPAPPMCHGEPADFVGTSGNDHFREAAGVFVLRGGDDRVHLEGDDPGAVVCANAGKDRVEIFEDGGGGDFLFDGGPGKDRLRGTGYTDTGTHLRGPMRLIGGAGDDSLFTDGRNDHLLGGPGDDVLWGARGNDVLKGGEGKDELEGHYGDDRLFGGGGADVLDGDDILAWGDPNPNGEDLAVGGGGFDRCAAERRRSCEVAGAD